jgi:hypothetical protein
VAALGGELEINVRTATGERVWLLDPEPQIAQVAAGEREAGS